MLIVRAPLWYSFLFVTGEHATWVTWLWILKLFSFWKPLNAQIILRNTINLRLLRLKKARGNSGKHIIASKHFNPEQTGTVQLLTADPWTSSCWLSEPPCVEKTWAFRTDCWMVAAMVGMPSRDNLFRICPEFFGFGMYWENRGGISTFSGRLLSGVLFILGCRAFLMFQHSELR